MQQSEPCLRKVFFSARYFFLPPSCSGHLRNMVSKHRIATVACLRFVPPQDSIPENCKLRRCRPPRLTNFVLRLCSRSSRSSASISSRSSLNWLPRCVGARRSVFIFPEQSRLQIADSRSQSILPPATCLRYSAVKYRMNWAAWPLGELLDKSVNKACCAAVEQFPLLQSLAMRWRRAPSSHMAETKNLASLRLRMSTHKRSLSGKLRSRH